MKENKNNKSNINIILKNPLTKISMKNKSKIKNQK